MTPGALDRSTDDWRLRYLADAEYRRAELGPKSVVVYEVDGVALGYAVIRRKAEWNARGPNGALTVLEAVGVTPRATRELWAWLLDVDLTGRIAGVRQPLPHPLQLLLADPRQLGLTILDGIWLRLLDVEAALGRRSYAAAGSLVLDVRDGDCAWNAGRWRLVAEGPSGPGRIERTDGPADLRLDVADLAAPYLGAFRFADLAAAGRVEEVRPGAAMTARPAVRHGSRAVVLHDVLSVRTRPTIGQGGDPDSLPSRSSTTRSATSSITGRGSPRSR